MKLRASPCGGNLIRASQVSVLIGIPCFSFEPPRKPCCFAESPAVSAVRKREFGRSSRVFAVGGRIRFGFGTQAERDGGGIEVNIILQLIARFSASLQRGIRWRGRLQIISRAFLFFKKRKVRCLEIEDPANLVQRETREGKPWKHFPPIYLGREVARNDLAAINAV